MKLSHHTQIKVATARVNPETERVLSATGISEWLNISNGRFQLKQLYHFLPRSQASQLRGKNSMAFNLVTHDNKACKKLQTQRLVWDFPLIDEVVLQEISCSYDAATGTPTINISWYYGVRPLDQYYVPIHPYIVGGNQKVNRKILDKMRDSITDQFRQSIRLTKALQETCVVILDSSLRYNTQRAKALNISVRGYESRLKALAAIGNMLGGGLNNAKVFAQYCRDAGYLGQSNYLQCGSVPF